MKKIIVVAIVTCLTSSLSYADCRHIEYAELRDMPQKYLVKTHCEFRAEEERLLNLVKWENRHLWTLLLDLSKVCRYEAKRSSRILEDRFNDKYPKCQ